MAWKASQFRLAGGVNEEDQQFTLPPGNLAFARNYECLSGAGYKRIEGYERFDGHTAKPSAATYKLLAFTGGGPRQIVSGDTVTGVTSAKTAIVVGDAELTSGSWLLSTAAGNIAVVAESGAFTDGETLTVGALYAAVVDAVLAASSVGDTNYKSWLGSARDYYRALISAVPGYGAILGGFVLGGVTFAWRATAADHALQALYKSAAGGWTLVALGTHLRFNTGTAEIYEGDTVTGATSTATGVVRRINIGAGNYSGPTYASGRFVLTGVTGTFQAAENLTVGGVVKAHAVAAQAATAMIATAACRHETVVTNFYGASNMRRVYGCDGLNRAYEFDGTYFINIETGMTTDTPNHIEAHRNHLFLTFPGGSVQNSGTGTPLTWAPRIGAGEIGIGDDATGLKSNGNDTLAITAQKTVQILQGTSNLDWSLKSISDDIGSVAGTMQEAGGSTRFLDRAGVNTVIPAPPTFQNYGTQAISRNVRKTVTRLAPSAVGSFHALEKDQYRLYFSDKSALVATFSGTKLMGWMHMLYTDQFTCMFGGQDAATVERMYAGTDDGYVMEMDIGTSFDGEAIASIMQVPYNYQNSADRNKRFHKITLEVDTPRAIELRLMTEFDYGAGGQSGVFDPVTNPTGGIWDTSLWEQFFWDSAVLAAPEINIDGVGRNIGITLFHEDAVDEPFTVSAIMLQYSLYGIRT